MDGLVGDDPVEHAATTPAALSGRSAQSMNALVGPLSTWPPTIGDTATTGAGATRSASAIPATLRIGRTDTIGFDGPMTIARAPAMASSTAAGALAA